MFERHPFLTGIYLLPTILSILHNSKHKMGIMLLNIFLGWTFLGWIGSLIWSTIDKDKYKPENWKTILNLAFICGSLYLISITLYNLITRNLIVNKTIAIISAILIICLFYYLRFILVKKIKKKN